MSTKQTKAPLPRFSPATRVYHRDESDEYLSNAYQYSSTSHTAAVMKPAAVIYPANLDDIILAVQYARENGVGVAVRTGGHQYSGASSTSGENIQLDLSDTFQSEDDFAYDPSTNLIRIGVSFSLNELNERLRKNRIFLPHGQCLHVHLGGHLQTGGYGQLGRAFGLLSDHVEGFEIVLANGEVKSIWKPNRENASKNMTKEENELNDDLYWAVLGGSPGNYGVLTHVTMRPHHDKDHPDSRGFKLITAYSKNKLEKVLEVIAQMNDDKDLPADFDICATVMSDFFNCFSMRKLFHLPADYQNLDEKMMVENSEDYADGVPWAEEGKLSISVAPVPAIVMYLQWANLKGINQKFGQEERKWFDKIKKAMSEDEDNCLNKCFTPSDNLMRQVMGDEDIQNRHWLHVDYEQHTPMSQLTRYWCWQDIREYVKPYEKRAYWSDKTDLSSNGWIQWMSKRLDKIAQKRFFNSQYKGLDVVAQIQPFGGDQSMFRINGQPENHNGSHSWRQELTMLAVMDCFYQPSGDKASSDTTLKKAMEWQMENDKGSQKDGVFCEGDLRTLWGSYAREGDPHAGANLHSVRSKYYDSEEKYNKLVDIKRKVDPDYVLTANLFGIDANNAPENMKILIVGRGHEISGAEANRTSST